MVVHVCHLLEETKIVIRDTEDNGAVTLTSILLGISSSFMGVGKQSIDASIPRCSKHKGAGADHCQSHSFICQ